MQSLWITASDMNACMSRQQWATTLPAVHPCHTAHCSSSSTPGHRHTQIFSAVKHPPSVSRCLRCAQVELGPADDGQGRVHSLLQSAGIPISHEAIQCMWHETPVWREQLSTAADVQAVEAGLLALLRLFSGADVARLLTAQPALLVAPLDAWLTFFEEYGFTHSQAKNVIAAFPEVLVQGSIASAGLAILHLKQLGFDDEAVRHKVVAFCPQVLMMPPAAIDNVVQLWSKFNAGVTERAC